MSNELYTEFPNGFSDEGLEKIIRAQKVSSCFAELLALANRNQLSRVSVEGVIAVFECLSEQLDGAIGNSELFQGETNVRGHDAD